MNDFRALLYYYFTPIADPHAFREVHHAKCVELGLKGRVILAKEGINGTVAGPTQATDTYKAWLSSLPMFSGIEWKEDPCDTVPFEKLKTKVRDFLVSFGDGDDVDPRSEGGFHMEPREWRRVLEEEKDYVLLDVRNDYEAEIGQFRGTHQSAVIPPYENFYDFPKWAEELAPNKEKKVLMYCTGGIRCEKFSAYLRRQGFQKVYQLHGGILNYAKKEEGAHFEGSCFVFDDRLTVPVQKDAKPIAHCLYCGTLEDKALNCANMECNRLFVCCDSCAEKHKGACSESCAHSPHARPFDSKTFRIPFRKKGVVFPELGLAKKRRTG